MLLKVLDAIKENKQNSFSEIANKLNISEKFLGQIIDDLIKRGYLQEIEKDCENLQCSNCAILKNCSEKSKSLSKKLVIFTEKGMKSYIERNKE